MDNYILNEIAGIKLKERSMNAKVISILRKYTNDSISNIKNHILRNEYIFSCNYIEDEKKLKKLILCHDELAKNNFEVDVYFGGKKEDIQVLKNWFQTSQEISDEGWDDLLETEE